MIEREELQTLIPHKGKMFLLSRVRGFDIAGTLQAEYDITEDCLFYDPALRGMPSWAGFELIAQAVSALSGIRDRYYGRKPKMGFILSLPSMRTGIAVIKCGTSAQIDVNECDCTGAIYTYEGKVYQEDKLCIEGKIMVMHVENEEEFLEKIRN